MILVDTSVWIDHLKGGDAALAGLLENGRVLAHPFVIGEIALDSLRQRSTVLTSLRDLPQAIVANDHEVLLFIISAQDTPVTARQRLAGEECACKRSY